MYSSFVIAVFIRMKWKLIIKTFLLKRYADLNFIKENRTSAN